MATTSESWHKEFDPRKFLGRVDLGRLIETNQAYNENLVTNGRWLCILCGKHESNGLLLNDKSFICKDCFSRVATISYPQKYEELRRDYLVSKEARRLAWEGFRNTYGYTSQSTGLVFIGWASLLLVFVQPAFLLLTGILLVVGYTQESVNQQKRRVWNDRQQAWGQDNPEPKEPELKHFHDPTAELSGTTEPFSEFLITGQAIHHFGNISVPLSRHGIRTDAKLLAARHAWSFMCTTCSQFLRAVHMHRITWFHSVCSITHWSLKGDTKGFGETSRRNISHWCAIMNARIEQHQVRMPSGHICVVWSLSQTLSF